MSDLKSAAQALFDALCSDEAYCDSASRDEKTQFAMIELREALKSADTIASIPILYCVICIHTKIGIAEPAATVKGGTAVCENHLGFVRDTNVNLNVNKRERES